MTKLGRIGALMLSALLCTLLLSAAPAAAAVRIFEEPGVRPEMAQDVRSAVSSFEQLLKDEMGTSLTQDVSLYICPSRDSYLRIWQREFRVNKDSAEKSDKVFGGLWYRSGRFGVIILDLSNPAVQSGQNLVASVGRQLFYQAIYQWAGDDFTNKALQWLAEGTADLVGSRVAEMCGYESVEKWKLDRFNTLRGAKRHVSPNDIAQRNPDAWLKYISDDKHPAEMADLMVFFLMQQKGLPAIAAYFAKLPAESSNRAFEKAFGMDMGQFLSDFQAWYVLAMGEPARVYFTLRGNIPDDVRAYFEKGAEMARQLAFDSWNVQLREAMRVVLTENRDSYVAAMAREFGVSPQQAAAEATNEFWTYRGSVVVMNVAALTEPEEKIQQTAFVVLSRLVDETGGPENMDNLKWLSFGAANIMSARSAERSGFARYGDFQGAWEYALARSRAWPGLTALTTLQNWSAAADKYGPAPVRSVASLSAHYLADKYGGYAKIGDWLKATKASGNPEAAFQKVYGMTTVQFWSRAQEFVEP